jgi:sulfonate transport system permease protein
MSQQAQPSWFAGLVGFGVILALWHLVAASGALPPAFLPTPAKTWDALVWGFTRGDMAGETRATVLRMAQGWLLASLIAVAIGSLIGISETARVYLRPMLAFLRSMPASAIVPLAIALVGLSPAMVLGVVVFGSVWPTLLATVQGFANLEPRLIEVGRLLGLSKAAFIWKIGLPNALPDIITGMRLSLTVALILAVVGEILSAQQGLGHGLLMAARAFRAADLFAGIAVLGVIGLVSSTGLLALERRLLAWRV